MEGVAELRAQNGSFLRRADETAYGCLLDDQIDHAKDGLRNVRVIDIVSVSLGERGENRHADDARIWKRILELVERIRSGGAHGCDDFRRVVLQECSVRCERSADVVELEICHDPESPALDGFDDRVAEESEGRIHLDTDASPGQGFAET